VLFLVVVRFSFGFFASVSSLAGKIISEMICTVSNGSLLCWN